MSMHINCPRYGAVGGDERLDDKNTYDTKKCYYSQKKKRKSIQSTEKSKPATEDNNQDTC